MFGLAFSDRRLKGELARRNSSAVKSTCCSCRGPEFTRSSYTGQHTTIYN